MRSAPAEPSPDLSANPFGLAQVVPRVLVMIFVIEGLIMLALARWPLPEPLDSIVDAGTLSLLSGPILYLWIVRPLRQRIARHLEAGEAHARDIARRMKQLAALDRLGQQAVQADDVTGICQCAIDAVSEALGPDRCAVLLADEQGRQRFRAWSGLSETYRRGLERWESHQRPGDPEHADDVGNVATEPLPGELRELLGREGIASYSRHRIVHEGRRIGRLMLYWNAPSAPDGDDTRVANTIASHVATVVDRVQRETEQQRSSARLAAAVDELVVARDAAEAAARAKAEFLATMSHEIRTPMNGVLGFTHLLAESQLTDEQRDYVMTIRNSGQALLGLLNDILDFSKLEAGRMTLESLPFDLDRLLREVTDLLRPQAGARGIALVYEPGAGLPPALQGDPGRVRQVLINLVGNAIKFTPAGSVTLRVRREQASSRLLVEVEDTGIGIPADKVDGLFQLFAQVDASTTRRFGGTGLGLAICRRLVEVMEGSIGVRSEEGAGSTFWFTLPVPVTAVTVGGDDGARDAAEPAPLVRDGAPLRVLVAEDNAVNQKLARRLLERAGCAVDVAGNGREAVDMAAHTTYDVVIMDCHMPEMDGFEATRAIREFRPRGSGLPIIALTASALRSDHLACLDAGMDDFLTKPIVPEQLHRTLERWAA